MPQLRPLTLSDHRHQIVGEALNSFNLDTILDVGGFTYRDNRPEGRMLNHETLRALGFPARDYYSVNVLSDYDNSRQPDVFYDGRRLPFKTSSVAAVTAIDTLEHVQESYRLQFIDEVSRVAARCALILFPHHSEATNAFEERLIIDLERLGISARPSLLEHRDRGLPNSSELADQLTHQGHQLSVSYHSPLDVIVPYHERQLKTLRNWQLGKPNTSSAQDELQVLKEETEREIANWTGLDAHSSYRALLTIKKDRDGDGR